MNTIIDPDFPSVSEVSLSTVHLSGYRKYNCGGNHDSIAHFSGFFYERSGELYIITNWHNLSGINPETGRYLGTFTPSHLRVYFKCFKRKDDGGGELQGYNAEVCLYERGSKPLWLEHPQGEKIDVVALKIDPSWSDFRLYPLNHIDFEQRWNPSIADDCYIVGYPEGIKAAANMPIWKRASIASEPSVEQDGLPMIFIDTIGNQGLSGSPVIACSSGIFNPTASVGISSDTIIGSWRNFLGVYSGRIGDSGVSFQLGRVWKARVIEEILEKN